MDFKSFFDLMSGNLPMTVAVILTLGVILVNGWTDAPNAIATCVSTMCMSERAAVLMAAVFNFFGVLIMTLISPKVSETITKMVRFEGSGEAMIALSAAMLAIVLWATAAWAFGIPTSESHALIAGLTGSAIALHGGLGGVNGGEWIKVLIGIVVSIALGFGFGWLICKGVTVLFRNVERRKAQIFFTGAQITGAASMAFMHGAQDGQKFMGIIILCSVLAQSADGSSVTASYNAQLWMMVLCSVVMGLGTSIGGKKIIKSVGMDMVKLEKYQGFSADIAAAGALLFCSLTGLPVSTTHVKTTSIMGVGAVKRLSAINLSVVKDMAMTWVATFPGCGLLGFLVTKLFMFIF